MEQFEVTATMIEKAVGPEDIFGALVSKTFDEKIAQARRFFRIMTMIVHPDHVVDKDRPRASDVMAKLNKMWDLAEARLKDGSYGRRSLFTVRSTDQTYTAASVLGEGGISIVYAGLRDHDPVVLKVVNDPKDNDLMDHELRIIKYLRSNVDGVRLHDTLPRPEGAFRVENRRVNVYAGSTTRLYPLEAIIRAYPRGVDPRDMVWMWKRCLGAIGYAHTQGVVHGAVLPPHILVNIEDHAVVIVGWTSAIRDPATESIKVLSPDPDHLYAPEILKDRKGAPGSDLYMLARCMVRLVGGGTYEKFSESIPDGMRRLLRACLLDSVSHRLEDAWNLHKEIDAQLRKWFGPRKFRVFTMPN